MISLLCEDLRGGFIRSRDLVHILCISYMCQGMSMSILGYDTGASRGGGEVLESFWQRASSHSLAYITEAAAQHHHQHHTGGVAEAEASHNNIQQITKNQRTSHRYTQSDTDSIWLFCIRVRIRGNLEGTQLTPLRKALSFVAQFFL